MGPLHRSSGHDYQSLALSLPFLRLLTPFQSFLYSYLISFYYHSHQYHAANEQ